MYLILLKSWHVTEGQSGTVSLSSSLTAQSYFVIYQWKITVNLKSRFECQPDFFTLLAEQVEDRLESYRSSAVIFSRVYVAWHPSDTRPHNKLWRGRWGRRGGWDCVIWSRRRWWWRITLTMCCHFCSANFISAGVQHPGNVGRRRRCLLTGWGGDSVSLPRTLGRRCRSSLSCEDEKHQNLLQQITQLSWRLPLRAGFTPWGALGQDTCSWVPVISFQRLTA